MTERIVAALKAALLKGDLSAAVNRKELAG